MELPSIHDPRFVEKMLAIREESEADDDWFERLANWRALKGDAIKSDWAWWWAEANDNEFSGSCASREDAIAEALAECAFFDSDGFELIEARSWTDELADDDFVPFAETRGAETLTTEKGPDGKRRLVAASQQSELFEGE